MKMVDIELIPVSISRMDRQRAWVVLKVHTDEGLIGISRLGLALDRPGAGDFIQGHLRAQPLGEGPSNVERLWSKMSEQVASWDIRGKKTLPPGDTQYIVVDALGQARDVWPSVWGDNSVRRARKCC